MTVRVLLCSDANGLRRSLVCADVLALRRECEMRWRQHRGGIDLVESTRKTAYEDAQVVHDSHKKVLETRGRTRR